MKVNTVKVFITGIGSMLSSLLGVLYIPVLLMVASNLIDYITGLMAAKFRDDKKISSYKSMRGIAKKIAMWLLVVVGAIIDQLILYATSTMGWSFPFTFLVACVVTIWIICNEIISILENIQDIGLEIPAFLLPLVKNIRKMSEESIYAEKTEEK